MLLFGVYLEQFVPGLKLRGLALALYRKTETRGDPDAGWVAAMLFWCKIGKVRVASAPEQQTGSYLGVLAVAVASLRSLASTIVLAFLVTKRSIV